jgi:hypothetical protein
MIGFVGSLVWETDCCRWWMAFADPWQRCVGENDNLTCTSLRDDIGDDSCIKSLRGDNSSKRNENGRPG